MMYLHLYGQHPLNNCHSVDWLSYFELNEVWLLIAHMKMWGSREFSRRQDTVKVKWLTDSEFAQWHFVNCTGCIIMNWGMTVMSLEERERKWSRPTLSSTPIFSWNDCKNPQKSSWNYWSLYHKSNSQI